MFAILCDSYDEEIINEKSSRTVLRLPKKLAPFFLCIMPLSNKPNDELSVDQYSQSRALYKEFLKKATFRVTYDCTGNIGNRYRRQDAIGTPYCITFDFDSAKDHSVTVRERDSMKQVRILIKDLSNYFHNIINEYN